MMKALQIKIMAYLQDCYLLDIDHSYKEYVIFELKYDHSDDFFIEHDYTAKFRTRDLLCHLDFDKFARVTSRGKN